MTEHQFDVPHRENVCRALGIDELTIGRVRFADGQIRHPLIGSSNDIRLYWFAVVGGLPPLSLTRVVFDEVSCLLVGFGADLKLVSAKHGDTPFDEFLGRADLLASKGPPDHIGGRAMCIFTVVCNRTLLLDMNIYENDPLTFCPLTRALRRSFDQFGIDLESMFSSSE
jgi:hypothetical protein